MIYLIVSKYPESFVKIEIMDRKKINIYYSVWVWNPLPQTNKKSAKTAMAIYGITCKFS